MGISVSQSKAVSLYKHPKRFFILSTLIPLVLWFVAGFISRITPYEDKFLNIASILAFIGLLAPIVVAFIFISKEPRLRRDVNGRFFNFREVKPLYLLLACLIMPVSILLAQSISLLFGYSHKQFIITGEFTFSSGIFPVWFLLIIAPVLEELAWHTYGTDSIHTKYNIFKTSLLFAVYWGIWHLPLTTIRDYYQSNVVEESWIYGLNFLVSIIPYVLLMNWLYYKTGRNIIITIIFHITAGFFNELFAPHPDSKIIQTVLLCGLATMVVLKEKQLFFQHQ
ncbi:CPBP family intramembrane glutamic endopeptidase [uncultured Bacteroides sp.]|jgi:CAAX amino terminal protease family protein|uniref:CPBP family intramembrane glutamic endopeptidase n=1 Tax=uncultured Bacteroides sp. TaxID=162156 RepID=UPI00280BC302|nr:CPBP family intramembrane glutamic endopeptidase [uncultured Bacteroides sp.]